MVDPRRFGVSESQLERELHLPGIAREGLAPLLKDGGAGFKGGSHEIARRCVRSISTSAADRTRRAEGGYIIEIAAGVLRVIEDVAGPSGKLRWKRSVMVNRFKRVRSMLSIGLRFKRLRPAFGSVPKGAETYIAAGFAAR